MKRRYMLMAVTAALVFAVAAGGTMAAQRVQSGVLSLGLNAANLAIEWSADGTAESDNGAITVDESALMPAGEYDFAKAGNNYSVQNVNGDSNMSAYVRVTVTKYWCDGNDAQADKDLEADSGLLTLTCDEENWTSVVNPFEGRTKSETKVFYYKTPLAPGASTTDLLKSMALSEEADNQYADKAVRLEAVAEAVQYVPGDNKLNEQAILSAWGVKATLNADGSISAISN